ncbi:MAG TPA: DUF924 family protein [Steroidobacteraceae bacterium]
MSVTPSSAGLNEPAWVVEVLRYWFEELGESRWFENTVQLDSQIRDRFLSLHEWLVIRDGPDAKTPRSLLAAVVVLDQFSRNLFRGTPRAFAADSIAVRLSRLAIGLGFDSSLNPQQRLFLYMPFEHSEAREDQVLAVKLISALGNSDWTRYAVGHKEFIDRFGRFPHRNGILNRQSTEDEQAILGKSSPWF